MAQNIVEVTDQTFQNEVLNSTTPVLVDFWAPWCGPCRQLAPTLERFAKESTGKVRVAKCNIQEEKMTAVQYRVTNIPTLVFFKNGTEIHRLYGLKTVDEMKSASSQYLGVKV
jgi:thioredoxin 1